MNVNVILPLILLGLGLRFIFVKAKKNQEQDIGYDEQLTFLLWVFIILGTIVFIILSGYLFYSPVTHQQQISTDKNALEKRSQEWLKE